MGHTNCLPSYVRCLFQALWRPSAAKSTHIRNGPTTGPVAPWKINMDVRKMMFFSTFNSLEFGCQCQRWSTPPAKKRILISDSNHPNFHLKHPNKFTYPGHLVVTSQTPICPLEKCRRPTPPASLHPNNWDHLRHHESLTTKSGRWSAVFDRGDPKRSPSKTANDCNSNCVHNVVINVETVSDPRYPTCEVELAAYNYTMLHRNRIRTVLH